MFSRSENIIKTLLFFSIILFYLRNIYINNSGIKVDADNLMNISVYENNIDYSKYSTNIKSIALYFPNFYPIQINNKILFEWEFIKNAKPLYEGHNQPREPDYKDINLNYYDLTIPNVIKQQVELAKSHGIYGFGIFYYWYSGKKVFEKPLDIIYENKDIDFHFLLIWRNKNLKINNEIIIKQEYNNNYSDKFIEDIKKYLYDSRYIKNNGKPIIGIYKPEKIDNLDKIISIWRQKAKECGIGEIFILVKFSEKYYKKLNDLTGFDGGYMIPPYNISSIKLIKNEKYYYYSGLLYEENNLENILKNLTIYRGTLLKYDNSPKKSKDATILEEYSNEKFYLINKLLIDWTKNNYDKNNRFIFINAWNNWIEGTYLEPDKKYGYSSINSFSKALFNIPYKQSIYNISNLQSEAKILIQVHAFYEDLMSQVINKTNNIPVKFDLYITTNTIKKQIIIEEMLKTESEANKYQIQIVENKGRDVLPYLTQLKDVIKKYKYVCHLHTKKTKYDPTRGERWRNYLYNNLFGDKDLISEILTDFENNSKLGVIYPETYYYEKENVLKFNKNNIKYMNYLLGEMFPNMTYKIGKKLFFPSGNMFWARVDAVYQVFEQDIQSKCPKEANQYDATILHGIERLWLFVAKINGYYYKTIFKYI